MIKVVIGDIFFIEKAVGKKLLRGTAWKIVKFDTKTKHYELKNVDVKTGKEISGRVATSYELKELEAMIKKKEIRKV
jgi:hypothetical protein